MKKFSIHQSQEAQSFFKKSLEGLSIYNDDMKREKKKELASIIGQQLDGWRSEVAEEIKKIDSELAEKKPKNQRKYDAESVAVLNYNAKRLRSRLAAEGHNPIAFERILREIVQNGEEHERLALVDSYHEIQGIARELNVGHVLSNIYRDAKATLRTPEEEAYEGLVSEAEKQKIGLQSNLMVVERNVGSLKTSLDQETFFGESNNNPWA